MRQLARFSEGHEIVADAANEKLLDNSQSVRLAATRALERMGGKSQNYIPGLVRHANSQMGRKNKALRQAAIKALKAIGKEKTIDYISKEIHKEDDFNNRDTMLKLIEEIDKRQVIPQLVKLADTNEGMKGYFSNLFVIRQLAKINSPRAGRELLKIFSQRPENLPIGLYGVADVIKKAGPKSIPFFISQLSHIESGTNEAAAKALSEIGGKSALKPLKEAAEKAATVTEKEKTGLHQGYASEMRKHYEKLKERLDKKK